MTPNCSFPFTYNGGLFYRCIANMTGVSTVGQPFACINVNATPVVCNSPGKLLPDYFFRITWSRSKRAWPCIHSPNTLQSDYYHDIVLNVGLHIPKPELVFSCLLYTSPSPRDGLLSRMPSSA